GLYCEADLGNELFANRRALPLLRRAVGPFTCERLMSGRVLVVDDVEANVKLLEAKLSSEYFEVLTAYHGRAALEIADAELPDVILLDVMMPRMDGFEACRQLKANPRAADIPVVMVTALSDVASR